MAQMILMAAAVSSPMAGAAAPVESSAQRPIAAICGLNGADLGTREAEVQAMLATALRGWRATPDAIVLRLHIDGLQQALGLVMLERQCCPGVGATLQLPPEGDVAELTLTGPPAFREMLRAMLGEPAR